LSEELDISPSVMDGDEKTAEKYNQSRWRFFRLILFLYMLFLTLWGIFTVISAIGSMGFPNTGDLS
tara:strand:- start:688 stop:885 length:198 start_codon:yes stop_codon:yes gene_type:complete